LPTIRVCPVEGEAATLSRGLAKRSPSADNSDMQPLYLDHNATTPIRPEVVEAMSRVYTQEYGNPAAQHQFGQRAHRALEEAREGVAEILGADLHSTSPDRLIFTSGGSEANDLAVLGIARASAHGEPGQVILSGIEHASVIGAGERLLDEGWQVDTLGAHADGTVRGERLNRLLSDKTRLVSVILANHETGVMQPVGELAAICNRAGVPIHTDAVQAVGKMPVDFRRLGVAAMSVAAHKFRGPLGIGALMLRPGTPIEPIFFGGHQQEGIRPGTECVALATGMWTALSLWREEHGATLARLTRLRDRFEDGLRAALPNIVVHGREAKRLPQTSNIGFPDIDGQILFTALDLAGVACSVGSACTSGSSEISPTLLAMGLPQTMAGSSLRFSLGTTTTEAEVDDALQRIVDVCRQITT
jgi:cysteine desulfurase